MLSTNLREVSQCLEKAPTRTFSLLRAPTSPATESYRRFVDSSSSGESAGDPGNVPHRPTQLRVHCPAQHPSISISNPLGCIPWPVPPPLVTKSHGCCSAAAASCTTSASSLWPAPGTRRAASWPTTPACTFRTDPTPGTYSHLTSCQHNKWMEDSKSKAVANNIALVASEKRLLV